MILYLSYDLVNFAEDRINHVTEKKEGVLIYLDNTP